MASRTLSAIARVARAALRPGRSVGFLAFRWASPSRTIRATALRGVRQSIALGQAFADGETAGQADGAVGLVA